MLDVERVIQEGAEPLASCVCYQGDCEQCVRIEAAITRLHTEHRQHHQALEAAAVWTAPIGRPDYTFPQLFADADAELGRRSRLEPAERWIIGDHPDLAWLCWKADRNWYLERRGALQHHYPDVPSAVWEVLAD